MRGLTGDADRLQQAGYGLDDHIGAAGIEQAYEKDLRGQPGKRLYQVEVTGQEVTELKRQDAQPGSNLLLAKIIHSTQHPHELAQARQRDSDDLGLLEQRDEAA